MKLAELVLELNASDYEDADGDVFLYSRSVLEILRKVFKLPKGFPRKLWLTFHSSGTPFREKLRVCEIHDDVVHGWEMASMLRREDGSVFCDCENIDDLIYPFIGKTVYLQVEYEE